MQHDEELSFDQPESDIEVVSADAEDECGVDNSFDCGQVAAWHLLDRALGKAKGTCRPGLYVVVAPGDAWVPALSSVAPKRFRGHPRRGLTRCILRQSQPEVRAHELRVASGQKNTDEICATIEQEIMDGNVVIVVAANQLMVPSSLHSAADRIIRAPMPDRKCIAAISREFDPTARRLDMRGLDFAAMTPTSLRLAYRPWMTACDFLRRLKVVARTPATKAPRLDSLHGVDEVKNWARTLRTDVASWRRGKIGWSDLSRGLLLAGPPGTGKTSLAAAIADHAGVNFVATSYATWQASGTGHLGDVVKAMARAFAEARERAPSIILIDEIDTLGARGGSLGRGDWWRTVINGLLELMDGVASNDGVIVIAATNHPALIDPAILRAGRLEERIHVDPPDTDALARIYADQISEQLQKGADLQWIAQMSAGATGADVVQICKTARRRARSEGRCVTEQDLLAALGADPADADPRERLRVAVHEAGHAIVAAASPGLTLGDLSIVGRGNSAGRASVSVSAPGPLTTSMLGALLAALLGGRAAEGVILGDISAGAGGGAESDLGRATQFAATAELSLGMGDARLVWYPQPSSEKIMALFARRPDIERAVQRRLDVAYARAKRVIEANAPAVRLLAERLLARKAVAADEVEALVGRICAAPVHATLPIAPHEDGPGPSVH